MPGFPPPSKRKGGENSCKCYPQSCPMHHLPLPTWARLRSRTTEGVFQSVLNQETSQVGQDGNQTFGKTIRSKNGKAQRHRYSPLSAQQQTDTDIGGKVSIRKHRLFWLWRKPSSRNRLFPGTTAGRTGQVPSNPKHQLRKSSLRKRPLHMFKRAIAHGQPF